MNDVRRRLIDCFKAVFPGLDEAEILDAEMNAVEAWTSLAAVNLLAVVEEEFAVRVDPQDYEKFVSFQGIERHLESMLGRPTG